MSLDMKIVGGTVVDGSGFPRYKADVGVRDGKIVAIGRITAPAKQEIDATGLIVAPGFIDIHTHYDAQACFEPLLSASLWHGVTTSVMGNCGLSMAPVNDKTRAAIIDVFSTVEQVTTEVVAQGPAWDWSTFGEYLDSIDKGLGMNVVGLVGYNAIRLEVMGPEKASAPATPEEIGRMKGEIRKAIDEGAFGWSTSISATHVDGAGRAIPSRAADAAEMAVMAEALAGESLGMIELVPSGIVSHGGLSPSDKSLMETMALNSGRPVVWNGHQFFWNHPDKWREDQAFMAEAGARGALIYGSARLHALNRRISLKRTSFFEHLSVWRRALALPLPERLEYFRDPANREDLRRSLDDPEYGNDGRGGARPAVRWEAFIIRDVALMKNKALEGRFVTDLVREQNKHVADVILDLAVEENLETWFGYQASIEADEPARGELISHPHAMLGSSDGGAHVNAYCMAGEPTYFIRYWVLDRGLMSLEEGVRDWTFKPAQVLGLRDRGLLQVGMAADIVIFDEKAIDEGPQETVQDFPAGETRIISRGAGIAATIVNGEVVTRDGAHTGAKTGRVLRSTDYRI